MAAKGPLNPNWQFLVFLSFSMLISFFHSMSSTTPHVHITWCEIIFFTLMWKKFHNSGQK